MASMRGPEERNTELAHYQVQLDRTIAAVRAALPEEEVADFTAAIESVHCDELGKTFNYWFAIAALNKAGLLEDFMSERSLATGTGIPFDEAFPGYLERWEQEQAERAA